MKKLLLLITLSLTLICYAKADTDFGLNVGAAIPTATLADAYEAGINIGAVCLFDTSSSIVDVALGTDIAWLSEKSGYYSSSDSGSVLFSIYSGPKFGKETGLYFLPAIAANVNDGDARIGVDLGGGILIPGASERLKVNINAKFSVLNLIGKEDGEDTLDLVKISIGLIF